MSPRAAPCVASRIKMGSLETLRVDALWVFQLLMIRLQVLAGQLTAEALLPEARRCHRRGAKSRIHDGSRPMSRKCFFLAPAGLGDSSYCARPLQVARSPRNHKTNYTKHETFQLQINTRPPTFSRDSGGLPDPPLDLQKRRRADHIRVRADRSTALARNARRSMASQAA